MERSTESTRNELRDKEVTDLMTTTVRLVTFSILLCLTAASSAAAATYGGDATGAEVTVTATGTTIRAATGSLSISGGMAEASLPVGDIPSSATGGAVTLAASALHSSVVGTGATTRAEASMGAVGLTVSGNQISADFLMARSTASCGPSVAGSSDLLNLVVNGQAISVTGSPNQTVSLPNGSVIINAQVPTIDGTSGQLSVTALRVLTHDTITGAPIADVLLTTVDARIDCAAGSSPGDDWISGGGWIPGELGGRATFGFVAGPGGTSVRGHLTLKDHSSGVVIHGTVMTSMTECSSGVSHFEGTDTRNNAFQVDVDDNGEPGAGQDTFTISGIKENGDPYINSGLLISGGNIQAHGFTCQ
jgi:hypothetical protein